MPIDRVIENVVTELELHNLDTRVLREICGNLKKDIARTQWALGEHNLTSARESLREIHHDCKEAIFTLRALRIMKHRPLSAPMATSVRYTTTYLERTADDIALVLAR
jgi:hypothetical protein